MFFRSHPLTEAAINYAICGVLSVLSFLAVTKGNVSEVFGLAQVQAMFVMLPAFFLWAVVGFFLRNRGYVARFVGAATVTAIVTVAAIYLFAGVIDSLQNSADKSAFLNLRAIPIVSTFAINSLIAAGFCQFWLVRRYEA